MFFFFKQKTAYELRISDWSSDVCSSDLAWPRIAPRGCGTPEAVVRGLHLDDGPLPIACRDGPEKRLPVLGGAQRAAACLPAVAARPAMRRGGDRKSVV